MASREPRFQYRGKIYRSDTCDQLVEAVEKGSVRIDALVRGHYPGRPLQRHALPAVATVGVWDATGPQDWGLDWHRNEGVELTFLESGQTAFAVGDQRFNLQPYDLSVTRPWQPHRVGDPNVGPGRLHWLILDVGVRRPNQAWNWPPWIVLARTDRERLTTILRRCEQPVWRATPDIRHCWARIAKAVETDTHGSSVSHLTVYLNELFVHLLDMFNGRNIPLDESLTGSMRTVQLFLNELTTDVQMTAHPWSVGQMASHCGLGATHFTHHCKQITHMSPIEYLNRCRIDHAQRLLRQSDLSVTHIAQHCGFSSSQYFATVLRRFTGQTPRQYRGCCD